MILLVVAAGGCGGKHMLTTAFLFYRLRLAASLRCEVSSVWKRLRTGRAMHKQL